MPDAHIEAPNQAELDWIGEHLRVLAEAGVDIGDPRQLGARYDALLADWLSMPEPDRPDPNPMINLMGLGLGEHIARRSGLSWVVASDEHGTEIALHGRVGDVLIYPTNAVAKRWVAGEVGFLPGFVEQVLQSVAGFRDAAGG
jgi:hypothetical protein